MLGPFFARDGTNIPPERWQQLASQDGYSDVAVTRFPLLFVVLKTRWLGHDHLDSEPPKIFSTRVLNDPEVCEITTATEEEAMAVHESLCARYRAQVDLLKEGGARILTNGVL